MTTMDDGVGDRQQPWWVGHPAVKYPTLAIMFLGVGSQFLLEGDAKTLAFASVALVLGPAVVFSAALLWRGTIRPIEYPPWAKRTSPLTAIVGGVWFVVLGISMLVDVFLAPEDRWAPVLVGAWIGLILMCAGLMIEVLSRTDTWPERWKAPYQRQGVAAERATAGDEPGEPAAPEGGA